MSFTRINLTHIDTETTLYFKGYTTAPVPGALNELIRFDATLDVVGVEDYEEEGNPTITSGQDVYELLGLNFERERGNPAPVTDEELQGLQRAIFERCVRCPAASG